MTRYARLNSPDPFVRARLQHALWLARKKRRGRGGGGDRALWTPESLGEDLVGWWDASDDATLLLVSVTVASWSSKASIALPATQSSLVNRPLFNPTAKYGLPGVVFDGVNDFLATEVFNPASLGGFADFSIFGVNWTTNTNAAFVNEWFRAPGFIGQEVPGSVRDFGWGVLNGRSIIGLGQPDIALNSGTVINDGEPRILGMTRVSSTGAVNVFTSGSPDGSGILPTGIRSSMSRLFLGALLSFGPYLNGGTHEQLLIKRALSVEDRQRVEGYLAHKWQLVWTLPASHPYKTAPPYARSSP